MDALLTIRDDRIDVQRDSDLAQGIIAFSEGPDRAWLHHTYTDAHGHKTVETAALWLVDTADATRVLAGALGAPIRPSVTGPGLWHVEWIINGVIARRGSLVLDQAVYLIQALASENVLDYDAHLFGG